MIHSVNFGGRFARVMGCGSGFVVGVSLASIVAYCILLYYTKIRISMIFPPATLIIVQNLRPIELLPPLPKAFDPSILAPNPASLSLNNIRRAIQHPAHQLPHKQVALGPAIRIINDMAHPAVNLKPYM